MMDISYPCTLADGVGSFIYTPYPGAYIKSSYVGSVSQQSYNLNTYFRGSTTSLNYNFCGGMDYSYFSDSVNLYDESPDTFIVAYSISVPSKNYSYYYYFRSNLRGSQLYLSDFLGGYTDGSRPQWASDLISSRSAYPTYHSSSRTYSYLPVYRSDSFIFPAVLLAVVFFFAIFKMFKRVLF